MVWALCAENFSPRLLGLFLCHWRGGGTRCVN
nr:MAG TPA_asm: hypothetical protein [Caudoviricetes sp.]